LKNKVERANEIRNTLAGMGYGDRNIAEFLWVKGGAIGESIGGGIDNIKKSAPVQRAGEMIGDMSAAATPLVTMFCGQMNKALPAPAGYRFQQGSTAMEKATEAYQKTLEKTSGLFAKVKENTAYKSIEERVGGVYAAARSKIPLGGGGADLEDAFKEGEKAAAELPEGGQQVAAPCEQPPPQQQQVPQQQQPLA